MAIISNYCYLRMRARIQSYSDPISCAEDSEVTGDTRKGFKGRLGDGAMLLVARVCVQPQ